MEDFKLQEECQNIQDVANYNIPEEHDVSSMDSGDVSMLLEGAFCKCRVRKIPEYSQKLGAVEAIAESPENINVPQVFDVYRSLLKCVTWIVCHWCLQLTSAKQARRSIGRFNHEQTSRLRGLWISSIN